MIHKQQYYTHDNGGRPFAVEIRTIDGSQKYIVKVGTIDEKIEESKKYFNVFYSSEIFVQKSGAYRGNSVLLKINTNNYVFIGHLIFSFATNLPVVEYKSPIGNNDVPYPYAVLQNGDIYLMLEKVILQSNPFLVHFLTQSKTEFDPYDFYYKNRLITPSFVTEYGKINEFLIGNVRYNLQFSTNPEQDYDRFKTFEPNGSSETLIEICVGDDYDRINLTKEMYVNLINNYGNACKFYKFNTTILCKRQYY